MEIKLNYEIEDIVFAKKVLAGMRELEKKFCELFKVKQKKLKLNLTIFHTREEYKKWTGNGNNYQNWMVGRCSGDNIGIISPKQAERSEKEMIEIACHEMAHFLLEKHFRVKNKVLDEGFACFLAGQMPTGHLENPPKIKQLEENFSNNGGYDFAPIYVKNIIENCGVEKFIKLLKLKKIEKHFEDNFEENCVNVYKKTNQFD